MCEALPMFQFVCTRCGKRCTNAGGLATKMKTHTEQKVDSPSLLRFFKNARLRKSRLNLSLSKRSHSKWNCGQNHAQSHFELRKFHDLQHRLSHQKIFPLLHQDDLDLLAHRRQIWANMLRLKALFLRIWTNDHQNFEWIISDIFENWRRMSKLKEDGFPMLDMTAYYTANESSLGVKLRRFHQFGFGNMRTIYKKLSKKWTQSRRSRSIKTVLDTIVCNFQM